MSTYNRYRQLLWIILFAALPAIVATALYLVTDNPTLRPLGITYDQYAHVNGEPVGIAIDVRVDWGRDKTEGISRLETQKLIADTLLLHTDSFVINFTEVDGTAVGVNFHVGPNHYGPYAPTNIVEGIVPALIALDMTQKKAKP